MRTKSREPLAAFVRSGAGHGVQDMKFTLRTVAEKLKGEVVSSPRATLFPTDARLAQGLHWPGFPNLCSFLLASDSTLT